MRRRGGLGGGVERYPPHVGPPVQIYWHTSTWRYWRHSAGFVVGFGMFGISEPSAEFQDTIRFQIANGALSVALSGGLLLLASVRQLGEVLR